MFTYNSINCLNKKAIISNRDERKYEIVNLFVDSISFINSTSLISNSDRTCYNCDIACSETLTVLTAFRL